MEFKVTPEALATAVKVNIEKQKRSLVADILNHIEKSLAARIEFLESGEVIANPNELVIYLPEDMIGGKIDQVAATEAHQILKDKGFNVDYTINRGDDGYSPDYHRYTFKA